MPKIRSLPSSVQITSPAVWLFMRQHFPALPENRASSEDFPGQEFHTQIWQFSLWGQGVPSPMGNFLPEAPTRVPALTDGAGQTSMRQKGRVNQNRLGIMASTENLKNLSSFSASWGCSAHRLGAIQGKEWNPESFC